MKDLYERTVRSRMTDSLKELGICVKEFATKARTHVSYWYAYKNGSDDPRLMDGKTFNYPASKIAKTLGKDPEWLWPSLLPTLTDEELDAPFTYMGDPDPVLPPYVGMMLEDDSTALHAAVNALSEYRRSMVKAYVLEEANMSALCRARGLSHSTLSQTALAGIRDLRKVPELTRDMFTDGILRERRVCIKRREPVEGPGFGKRGRRRMRVVR